MQECFPLQASCSMKDTYITLFAGGFALWASCLRKDIYMKVTAGLFLLRAPCSRKDTYRIPGQKTAFPDEVEEILPELLRTMAKHGFALGKKEVLDVVKEYVEANSLQVPFKDRRPGNDWLKNFCERQRLKNLEPLEKARRTTWKGDKDLLGTYYSCTENGWMTTSVLQEFLVKFELEQTQRLILLILDEHLTHLDMSTAQFARRNDITIIKLPAHTTDNSCDQKLVSWYRDNNKTLQKNEFVNLLSEVWAEGLKPENIISVFRSTGIYPTDRNKYPVPRFNLDKHQRHLESQHQPDHPSRNIPTAENLDLPLDVPGPSQHTSSFPAPRLLKRNDSPDDTSPTQSTSARIKTTPTFETLLLHKLNRSTVPVKQRRKIDPGAKAITSQECINLQKTMRKQMKTNLQHHLMTTASFKMPQPDDYEDLDQPGNLKPGDVLLVKCKSGKRNKTVFKYVATVLRILPNEEIEVMGLKSDGDERSFIPKEENVFVVPNDNVVGKLPFPSMCVTAVLTWQDTVEHDATLSQLEAGVTIARRTRHDRKL
ncbi:hypothetical protein PR048_008080 [Dryococelus australis]|uniref:DDE-1 domain-containing protein n=1 Tax=Dryococelus australis TaxID=614101 RepID=A0ABQ9HW27_9NEOP|nr:hypothetical protein PR048_008080 [Dryococelus australis]